MPDKKAQFATNGYDITVFGRNVMVTDAIKKYVTDKFTKVDRVTNRVIEVHVTLDIQRTEHIVDVLMKVGHTQIKVHSIEGEMYASVDKALDKLMNKIRRYKSRLVNHHAKDNHVVDMNVNVFEATDPTEIVNQDIEAENARRAEAAFIPHRIVSRETRPLKTLTIGEAEMKMELSGDRFMIFRSEEDRKLKVIYRRTDGHFGVIEPE